MAIVTWNTPAAGTGNWSADANWVGLPPAQPVANDDVVIPGTGSVSPSFTVTYDLTTPIALDSLLIGDGQPAQITLAVGGNTLAVLGTGVGSTQTISLQEAGGAVITVNGGAILAGALNLTDSNQSINGFGTLSIATIAGTGNIFAAGGVLAITGGTYVATINFTISDTAGLAINEALVDGTAVNFIDTTTGTSQLQLASTGAVSATVGNMNVTSATPTDTILLPGQALTITSDEGMGFSGNTGSVTFSNGLILNFAGVNTGGANWFVDSGDDGSGGTVVFLSTVACFCRGTLILTERGEVPVEQLAIGDRVVTVSGEPKPVKWLGHRTYDGRFIGGDRGKLPVRVAAGALADGVPARDLQVSPEHALYIDNALIAARLIVNGTTITQADAVDVVEYFHVELEAHEIIIAEGAATESYIECDNRGMFRNAAEFDALYPDDQRVRAFCAPRLEAGVTELETVHAAIAARAAALGWTRRDAA